MATSRAKQEKLAMQYGYCYSALLELDVIRFTVVDPKHNLFLCTAKWMFQLWIEKPSHKSLAQTY